MNDTVLIAVYSRMLQTHGCSVDDVLESPELRTEYLAETRRSLGNLPEQQLLHRLTALRKASKLPRRVDLVRANTSLQPTVPTPESSTTP